MASFFTLLLYLAHDEVCQCDCLVLLNGIFSVGLDYYFLKTLKNNVMCKSKISLGHVFLLV